MRIIRLPGQLAYRAKARAERAVLVAEYRAMQESLAPGERRVIEQRNEIIRFDEAPPGVISKH
jgi:hypothetical protein